MIQNRELHEQRLRHSRIPLGSTDPIGHSHAICEPREEEFRNSLRRAVSQKRNRSQSPAGEPHFHRIRHKDLPMPTTLPFNDPAFESLKFGNIADCQDSLYRPMRFTPQSGVHWQLNLRSETCDDEPFLIPKSSDRATYDSMPTAPPYESVRFPGCEGSSVSMWKHLYKPGVTRANLAWETTLRGQSDIRTENSSFHRRRFSLPRDSIIQSDPKLNYIYSH